ncbi:MAG: protoporphyrinogen oxidase [Frankiaceae bacterium]|nr:protoporphyrinogen oxidase [Frankiaceae bacterium]MBV9872407.1 protoporphyrinogen oxidase [Frankiaceae bacterium]
MRHVVVIGGGISGLAAALALVDDGVAVTLIESAPAVGGKLRISEVAGVPVDEGAEMFLRRVPEALDLVAAVGRADELVSPRTTAAEVWARGALRAMPAGTVMGLPGDAASLLGVLSADEVDRVRQDAELPGEPPGEDISVGGWVSARVGPAVTERLVDPLLGGVYAGRADELSLAATIPQLPRDERSLLAAVRRARPAAPSSEPVFATVTGGMGSLPASVAQAITRGGGTIMTGRTVRRLEATPTGWRVVHGATTDEQVLTADGVVVALPPSPAARLLADVAPAAAGELAAIDSASMAIVTTAWRTDDVPDLETSGYLVPAVYDRPVKAVTFASSKWAHVGSDDVVIVRCSIGRHGDVRDLQRDDADLIATATAELSTYAGFTGGPVDSRVSRWGGALPQYTVGHRERVRRIHAAVDALPGVAVCGATYDGVGVPACIRTGRAAAARVVAAMSPGPR